MTQKTPLISKIDFAILSLVAFSSCQTTIPRWDGKLYAGSSGVDGVERRQEHETVKCADPKFDDMVCMSYADLEAFYSTYVLGCKEWKSGSPTMSLSTAVKQYQTLKNE